MSYELVVDPGFPVRGGVDLRRGHFSVKMKKLGPVGERALGMPPRSANAYCICQKELQCGHLAKANYWKLYILGLLRVSYGFSYVHGNQLIRKIFG